MPYFEAGNEASAAIFNFFAESRPKTLLHGDSRMENVCFDPVTGAPRMYDWQLTSTGQRLGTFAISLPNHSVRLNGRI